MEIFVHIYNTLLTGLSYLAIVVAGSLGLVTPQRPPEIYKPSKSFSTFLIPTPTPTPTLLLKNATPTANPSGKTQTNQNKVLQTKTQSTVSVLTPIPNKANTPTLTPTRIPNPPIMNISYPSEMQSITMTQAQTFCVADSPAGGTTQGAQRKYQFNDGGWSSYSPVYTLCLEPKEGLNRLQMQYKNMYGEESAVYTRQFNFHRISEITITISGQLYRDVNCNGVRDGGEGAIGTSATINIAKLPEFYNYSTFNTDSNGWYSYSGKILDNESVTLSTSAVSPYGYKSPPPYNPPSVTFNSSNRNATIDIPQVPAENVGVCFPHDYSSP